MQALGADTDVLCICSASLCVRAGVIGTSVLTESGHVAQISAAGVLPSGAYRGAVTKKDDTPVIVTAVQMPLHPTTAPLATGGSPHTSHHSHSPHHTHHSGVPAAAAIPAAAAVATGTHEHRHHDVSPTTEHRHDVLPSKYESEVHRDKHHHDISPTRRHTTTDYDTSRTNVDTAVEHNNRNRSPLQKAGDALVAPLAALGLAHRPGRTYSRSPSPTSRTTVRTHSRSLSRTTDTAVRTHSRSPSPSKRTAVRTHSRSPSPTSRSRDVRGAYNEPAVMHGDHTHTHTGHGGGITGAIASAGAALTGHHGTDRRDEYTTGADRRGVYDNTGVDHRDEGLTGVDRRDEYNTGVTGGNVHHTHRGHGGGIAGAIAGVGAALTGGHHHGHHGERGVEYVHGKPATGTAAELATNPQLGGAEGLSAGRKVIEVPLPATTHTHLPDVRRYTETVDAHTYENPGYAEKARVTKTHLPPEAAAQVAGAVFEGVLLDKVAGRIEHAAHINPADIANASYAGKLAVTDMQRETREHEVVRRPAPAELANAAYAEHLAQTREERNRVVPGVAPAEVANAAFTKQLVETDIAREQHRERHAGHVAPAVVANQAFDNKLAEAEAKRLEREAREAERHAERHVPAAAAAAPAAMVGVSMMVEQMVPVQMAQPVAYQAMPAGYQTMPAGYQTTQAMPAAYQTTQAMPMATQAMPMMTQAVPVAPQPAPVPVPQPRPHVIAPEPAGEVDRADVYTNKPQLVGCVVTQPAVFVYAGMLSVVANCVPLLMLHC